jgi:hypothetical protein
MDEHKALSRGINSETGSVKLRSVWMTVWQPSRNGPRAVPRSEVEAEAENFRKQITIL